MVVGDRGVDADFAVRLVMVAAAVGFAAAGAGDRRAGAARTDQRQPNLHRPARPHARRLAEAVRADDVAAPASAAGASARSLALRADPLAAACQAWLLAALAAPPHGLERKLAPACRPAPLARSDAASPGRDRAARRRL